MNNTFDTIPVHINAIVRAEKMSTLDGIDNIDKVNLVITDSEDKAEIAFTVDMVSTTIVEESNNSHHVKHERDSYCQSRTLQPEATVKEFFAAIRECIDSMKISIKGDKPTESNDSIYSV